MKPYLYRLADVFLKEYGSEISEFTFVFPNRRAGLFFQKYLSDITPQPIFAPDFFTINQCFDHLSSLRTVERLTLLFALYDVYVQHTNQPESFDQFIFWGEMLLADFNEIDKHLVDAKQLFTNVSDLKSIDVGFDFLEEEQLKAIRAFWSDFHKDDLSDNRKKFSRFWEQLYPIYEQFTQHLLRQKIAYGGLLQRQVIADLNANVEFDFLKERKFVFVGFNALNPCEKALLLHFQKNEDADFYWNYESEYVLDAQNKAGMFVDENRKLFPSKLTVLPPEVDSLKTRFEQGNVHLVGVPSEVGQTAYASKLLGELLPHEHDHTQTAVVLPNENLLLPLLPGLSAVAETINITMGYPLSVTPIFGLMDLVFDLQKKVRRTEKDGVMFYHKSVLSILKHQYVNVAHSREVNAIIEKVMRNNLIYVPIAEFEHDELLQAIFVDVSDSSDVIAFVHNILDVLGKRIMSQRKETDSGDDDKSYLLDMEYIGQYAKIVNRIRDILLENERMGMLGSETLFRMLRELTHSVSIPFVGEPLNGLQIMGTLETRCLDFKNLIILSMNDGIFPNKQSAQSLIPYNLRQAFGMATHEKQDAIFAYNFYRLIHQAENIYFVYDVRTDAVKGGEVSRFVQQLKYQYDIPIEEETFSFELLPHINSASLQISKDERIMGLLHRFFVSDDSSEKKAFSPSALNAYLQCPLSFYLECVEGLREQDTVEETIEASMFGTIFHKAMEYIYAPFVGRVLEMHDVEEIRKDTYNIEKQVRLAFTKEYLHQDGEREPQGNDKLICDVIINYIHKLLERDKEHAPFTYMKSEQKVDMSFPINGGKNHVNLKGIVDRVDCKDGKLRIVDYKTGRTKMEFSDIADAFNPELKERPKFVLQTFLYAMLYAENNPEVQAEDIEPAIVTVRDLFSKSYSSQITQKKVGIVTSYADYDADFRILLTDLLEEIMNPEIPFTQCGDAKCKYCKMINSK